MFGFCKKQIDQKYVSYFLFQLKCILFNTVRISHLYRIDPKQRLRVSWCCTDLSLWIIKHFFHVLSFFAVDICKHDACKAFVETCFPWDNPDGYICCEWSSARGQYIKRVRDPLRGEVILNCGKSSPAPVVYTTCGKSSPAPVVYTTCGKSTPAPVVYTTCGKSTPAPVVYTTCGKFRYPFKISH